MNNRRLLVTGGAGFIGVHTCEYFAQQGWHVSLIDNLSRTGTKENLNWLNKRNQVSFNLCDIREYDAVVKVFAAEKPDAVIHLAGQVAVTSSVVNPREDFEINALGTFNVLESLRNTCPKAFFINASTNKVYGKMDSLRISEVNGKYMYSDLADGVPETFPLDFHSPYGCSKGSADQYSMDYGRIYGLKTTVFRQSCIYGTRQFGIEDQGWVAWFSIAGTLGKHISVFGDGKQTRDVLNIADLVAAYQAAIEHQDRATGEVFNIGGGPKNILSLLELLVYLKERIGREIAHSFHDWRPGDQRTFVCDIAKAKKILKWEPKIGVREGVLELIEWTRENSSLFAHM